MAAHPLFAAMYDRVMAPVERAGLADRRRELLGQARGTVLEVGGGTGLNLPHYPSAAERVVVLEPDDAMRHRLLARVAEAPVPVEVHEAGIEQAPFDDDMFDTVVSTLTLCTVADPAAALRQMRRVLKPDGRLLFLEHVVAPGARGRVQKAARLVWSRLAAGCHPARDTVGTIRDAGFVVTSCDRFAQARANPIVRPHAAGVAIPAPPTGAAA